MEQKVRIPSGNTTGRTVLHVKQLFEDATDNALVTADESSFQTQGAANSESVIADSLFEGQTVLPSWNTVDSLSHLVELASKYCEPRPFSQC